MFARKNQVANLTKNSCFSHLVAKIWAVMVNTIYLKSGVFGTCEKMPSDLPEGSFSNSPSIVNFSSFCAVFTAENTVRSYIFLLDKRRII